MSGVVGAAGTGVESQSGVQDEEGRAEGRHKRGLGCQQSLRLSLFSSHATGDDNEGADGGWGCASVSVRECVCAEIASVEGDGDGDGGGADEVGESDGEGEGEGGTEWVGEGSGESVA